MKRLRFLLGFSATLVLALSFSLNISTVQAATIASTSFEEPGPDAQYVDTGDPAVDHDLVNNIGQSPVDYTSVGGELGFDARYVNTRGSVGLTDGDFVGVTGFTGVVGAFTDGTQGYQMSDTDGQMIVELDPVDGSGGTAAVISLDLFVQETGWEDTDNIVIQVTSSLGTTVLLDTRGSDIDDLGIEDQWITLQSGLPLANDLVLSVALDSNSGSEAIYIDNVVFSDTPNVTINEIRIDQPGGDDDEYAELAGFPGTSLNGLTYLVIGDGATGSGTIENVTPLGGIVMPADGFLLIAEDNDTNGASADLQTTINFENSDNVTHLLVSGFTGANGDDLDTNDDGVLDVLPWAEVLDAVGLVETPGAGDAFYGAALGFVDVGPDGSFVPAHVFRCDDGTGNFVIGGFNFPTDDTPGISNGTACALRGAPPLSLISDVQGDPTTYTQNGFTNQFDSSPQLGNSVQVQGVVVGDFQENDEFSGFFVQEETADEDGDPLSSEAIFVFCDTTCEDVAVGNIVTVIGAVDEYFSQTQIDDDNNDLNVIVDDAGNNLDLVTPATVTFPLTPAATDTDPNPLEAFESMMMQVESTMIVTEYFEYDRYSQIRVWNGAGSRPYQFTQNNAPDVTAFAAAEREFFANSFFIDDGNSDQNVGPKPYPENFLGANSIDGDGFRGGDQVTDLFGIFNHARSRSGAGPEDFRLFVYDFSANAPIERPTGFGTPALPTFTSINPRPTAPPTGGNLTVASFNVLNYFTTLGARGADTQSELDRQTDKIVQAMNTIDADIFGLMEIENIANSTALATLTDELNLVAGAGTYDYINTGLVGTDAITVAYIYKPSVVTPVGAPFIVDDQAFTDPNNTAQQRNRPAIIQTFEVTDANNPDFGGVFTVVVNHFKSKGSSTGVPADDNQGDGQGNSNDTRTKAADYLVNTLLPTDPTGAGDADVLIIGDLNAYASEDPITTITNAGYTDMLQQFSPDTAYGYVFDGRWGTLDYALASSEMVAQIVSAADYHINADEPDALDYDETFSPSGWYAPNQYRASDHDPVIVNLDLTEGGVVQATPVPDGDDGDGAPQIGVFDPAISKLGLLVPDEVGITGEELEWVVTVSNTGTEAGINVVVTDTLVNNLRVDSVDAPGGIVTISGQTVSVTYPVLNVGQTVQFSIFTTVLDGVTAVDNTVCINADNQGVEECAFASSISELPQTGETPWWATVLMMTLAGLGAAIIAGFGFRVMRQRA